MAVNFTDSPSNGATITAGGRTYTYSSSTSTWEITATTAANPSITAVASGTLANGDMVVVNSDGTVSAVTQTGSSAGTGSATVFESDTTRFARAAFDSNANKVVIAYSHTNNFYGYAVVGTVSGNSISFGSEYVYYSGINLRTALGFDSTNNKVIVAYRAHSNSGHGRAQVGTISGTSISFGSYATFNTANIEYTQVVHDSSNDKIVVLYRDDGNSTRGTAIVGTVSGTSISFGSETVFETDAASYLSAHFASNINKIVVGYEDSGNSSYGTAIAGTVSGTSISFGSPVVYANNGSIFYQGGTFDSNEGKSVFVYQDGGNSDRGTAVVLQLADSSSTNLTANNYIGVSDAAYANSATATIQLIGSVDDAQSGLTPGQSHYIQNDGTLSTSAGTPSVLAGTAISATKLIVKGEIAAAAAAGLLVSSSGGVTTYANIAALPSSGNTAGDLAFVTDVKAFYGWDGTEWDRIFSGQNMLPEFTTSPAASYDLALDGTATTVTVAATDPEGFAITYSHDTTPANQAQATISQSGGTFTVTPSTTASNAGTFTARFKAFDGVRTNSASSTFSLAFYEYVNWTTTNNYYNSGSGWQLNDNGNNIEVYNAGNLGTLSATHTTYTIANSQSGLSKVYYEFTTNSSQAYYSGGFISTAKINSDLHLRDVTTNTTGHYGGEGSASGGATYSFMLDRNTKKLHYWKNGTYDSTRSGALPNGTYYAAIGDGASGNTASSSTKSIIRGINSNGTATFTYNPDTLWNNLTSGQQGP